MAGERLECWITLLLQDRCCVDGVLQPLGHHSLGASHEVSGGQV